MRLLMRGGIVRGVYKGGRGTIMGEGDIVRGSIMQGEGDTLGGIIMWGEGDKVRGNIMQGGGSYYGGEGGRI